MRFITISFLILAASAAMGQVTVTGSNPANNTTNVPLFTTITITFSTAMDTTTGIASDKSIFTNAPIVGSFWSADRRTASIVVFQSPSTVYFVLLFAARSAAGVGLSTPFALYWTTGTSFPSNVYNVTGQVTSGSTGISPANSIVGLTVTPFTGNQPTFAGVAVTDGAGQFTVPYMPDGTWYPLAAKDANLDGDIDPSTGDPIGFGDSVIVSGSNATGVVIPFVTFDPIRFAHARDTIATMVAAVSPPTRQLREFFCWGIDTTGAAREYVAVYTIPGGSTKVYSRVETMSAYADALPFGYDWVYNYKPFAGLATAALLDSVVARAERTGGRTFRRQTPPVPGSEFQCYARLGDLKYTEFGPMISDTSQFYWGLAYTFQVRVSEDSSYGVAWKFFLANAATGDIIGFTGVDDQEPAPLPKQFALGQNYPNPFNPSTTISFSLPVRSKVTLQVFNLLGQVVATLVNDERMPGNHQASWEPMLPSGIYFYRLEATTSDGPAQRFSQVRKMVLVK